MSSSSSTAASLQLAALTQQKLVKLEQQREVSLKMNGLLNKELIVGSEMCTKNLKAAIAVSRQAGYFQYYSPSPACKEAEESKVLNQYARTIAKLHNELTQIDAEIALATAELSKPKMVEQPISSLSAWFDTYGKPALNQPELLSTFSPAPKIYGGTNHHRSFKTSSSILKKGRLTR